jgi:molecular chaperone DnaK
MEALVSDLIDRTVAPCENALRDAKLTMKDIDEVVLVGGMTRMPAVIAKVKELFGKEPHKGVNPDEVVAVGAAIQGGVIGGDIHRDIVLVDVTPLSLGIETMGGIATKLIERNAKIPTSKTQVFSTAADNQTSVEVHVVQGERELARDNKSLGRFILDGILSAPRGMPQIEVTFDIDANGIVHVGAKDLGTGKEQSIKITAPTKLSKEEIDKFVKEAEKFASEDEKRKETVDIMNQADTLVYATEKALKEYGDKVSQQERADIEAKINDLKQAMKDKNIDSLKRGMDELTKVSHKLAEEIYKKTQAKEKAQGQDSTQQGPGPDYKPEEGPDTEKHNAGSAKDDVIDAEFRPEDDNKKGKK